MSMTKQKRIEGVNAALIPEFRLNDMELTRLEELLDSTLVLKSSLRPSQWYEEHMVMPSNDTFPGPARYNRTPYWAEPVDCFDPNHPAIDVSIMGPAQMGKSVMVLFAIVAYCISQNPVNILLLTGHSELSKGAMEKIDYVIKCCGLEHLITPNILKKRNNRSGDTAEKKEFRGAELIAGSITNHNLLRQNTARITLSDDLDAGKLGKEETGSTIGLIKGRTRASEDRSKRGWITTPQVKGRSLIEIQLDKSDKRYWFVQCPHCGTTEKRIRLEWFIQVDEKNTAGLTWKLDSLGRVDPKSVEYVCQLCAGSFGDKDKHELLNSGIWQPTQEWTEPYHFGYIINGMYAPHGMTSWYNMAVRWQACNPVGGARVERDFQTWQNIDYGDLYEEVTENPSAVEILKRVRAYTPGIIPEKVSEDDGNGDIVFLSLAADCNGKLNDARIDWEIRAVSRQGPVYSVQYGSIGTFIPNQNALEKERSQREVWSYEMGAPNSVWPVMDQLLEQVWKTDTGRGMKIYFAGIDCGYLTENIFNYIDRRPNFPIIGLMGDKEKEFVAYTPNMPVFKKSTSRNNLFMLNVNMIKDNMANKMKLKWAKDSGEPQPHQYMNYPKYDYDKYFSHLESESKRENDKGKFLWQKKGPTSQNHFWDVAGYQDGIQAVFLWLGFHKVNKDGSWTWADYARMVPVRKK